MSDYDEYEEVTYDDASDAGGSEGPVTKAGNACKCACVGVLIFFGCLFMLAWNERNFVCTNKALLEAEATAMPMPCGTDPGAAHVDGKLVYVSCAFDEATIPEFGPTDFGLDSSLSKNIDFKSPRASMTVSMYQCIEHEHTKKKGDKQVHYYEYSKEYRETWYDTTSYRDHGKKVATCGSTNPSSLNGLSLGSDVPRKDGAAGIKVGKWTLTNDLVDSIPIDTPVELGAPVAGFKQSAQQAPATFTSTTLTSKNNGKVLSSCESDVIGCLRIKFEKASASFGSVLSKGRAGGEFDKWHASDTWMCSAERDWQWAEWTYGQISFADFMTNRHEANEAFTWAIRVLGVLGTMLGVYCFFQPIYALADIAGDALAYIPCFGELLEDAIEGFTAAALGIASALIGAGVSFIVIGIAWLVMRPVIGATILGGGLIIMLCARSAAKATIPPGAKVIKKKRKDIENSLDIELADDPYRKGGAVEQDDPDDPYSKR